MPQRKALLMGTNYINNPPRFLLQGCYTDVEWAEETLTTKCQFSKDNIRVYRDDDCARSFAKPTREEFLKAIEWLVKGAQPGDVLFWHFSGHGIQVPIGEREGFEWEKDVAKELGQLEMANGQQEALAPCDIEWVGGRWANFVSTYEMRRILKQHVPEGCLLLCIFDCCHSGTTLRSADNPDVRPRCLPRDLDNPDAVHPMIAPRGQRGVDDDLEEERSFPDYCVLIAGAHSKQTAADAMIDGKKCGALSCYLYKQVNENPRISYGALVKTVKTQLKEKRFTQVPQLDALEDRDNWAWMDTTALLAEVKENGGTTAKADQMKQQRVQADTKKKAQTAQKFNKFMDEEGMDDVDSVIDSELSNYNIGGLSGDIVNSLYSRGLSAPGQAPSVSLSDLLSSSKLKAQLQHLTAHGVSSLADVGKLSPKDWDFIKMEVGLRNRLVNSCAISGGLANKLSQEDLVRVLRNYIVESDTSVLSLAH